MKLSTIPIQFRTTVFGTNFGIQLNATLDPYRVTPEGRRIDKLFFPGRIVSTGWSFGYTFKSRQDNSTPAINDINSVPPEYANPYYDPYGILDPVLRRQYMAQSYYDFSLPWNLGFNYHGLLLDQLRQQRYDGLPQEHHAEHRVRRQRQPHAQRWASRSRAVTTSRRTS